MLIPVATMPGCTGGAAETISALARSIARSGIGEKPDILSLIASTRALS